MAPSPPKPWERSGAAAGAATPSTLPSSTTTAAAGGAGATGVGTTSAISGPANAISSGGTAPALPERPAGMTTAAATTGAYGSTLATSPYATGVTSSAYSSPYSRYGTMGSYGSMGSYGGYGGGGYGSYGSGYGSYGGMGYGGGMYGGGMGGYGGGMYGGMGGMGGPYGPGGMGPDGMSLSQRMEAGTAATFQILQSLVGAVGGFAQMLESTFMATHSSFFAMIGVAEQFGHLRNYLGQVLSVFALLRWCRALLYRLVGKVPPGEGLNAEGFRAFEAGGGAAAAAGAGGAGGGPPKPKISKRPLIVFFLTVIGLPWLMNRLVRLITARQEAEAARLGGPPQFDAMGRQLPPSATHSAPAALDPSQLTFTRALFPYSPPVENADKELAFDKDEIIAVLAPSKEERAAQAKAQKIEGAGGAGTWWMGRKRDGTTGWFPSTYVQELPMNGTTAGGEKRPEEVKA
ncbi:hypothetical protein JCM11251_002940 [Rhodosporidiobolus azoricus]